MKSAPSKLGYVKTMAVHLTGDMIRGSPAKCCTVYKFEYGFDIAGSV